MLVAYSELVAHILDPPLRDQKDKVVVSHEGIELYRHRDRNNFPFFCKKYGDTLVRLSSPNVCGNSILIERSNNRLSPTRG